MGSELPSGWEAECLESCVSAIIDYRGKSPRKTTSGVPLITAKIVKNGRVAAPTEFIAEADYDSWMRRGLPQSGDVLITTEAPLGEVAQLDGSQVALAQRLILLRGNPTRVQNDFLRYALQSSFVQSQLKARSTGTTVLGIRQSELRKVIVPLPPLAEQRRIADALGALDDKIELNRRMSRTLESIARVTFKSWFVDFDPVSKKAQGCETGLSLGVAALFPERLVKAGGALAPDGWETTTLGRCFRITMGQSPPGSSYNEDGVGTPFYQGRRDFGSRFPAHRVYCTSPSRLAHEGDTLLSVRAPIGATNLAFESCCIGRGVAAIRHASGASTYTFETMHFAGGLLAGFEAGGTVFGSINGKELASLPVVDPPDVVIAAYEDLTEPLARELRALHLEQQKLTELRDCLMPRLLSGAIRIDGPRSSSQ